jgi:N-acetyl-gamma-glutamyl-phosphate reductase
MHTLAPPSSAPRAAANAAPLGRSARVAIAGATGYTGQELLRLLARHPAVALTAAMASGTAAPRPLPAIARIWDGMLTPLSADTLVRDADVVFLAIPDAAAAEMAPVLVDAGLRVVDLSGAFRLQSADARAKWYPDTQRIPSPAAYGLTERAREAVAGARLVANPGCYPTATLLALAPLVDADLLVRGADIIIDAKSGVSGAGKTPSERTHFSECHGNLSAYGIFNHRHAAEIEQGLGGASVTFVPHLVPLDRGILATIYVRLKPDATEENLASAYARAYADAPFVRLVGSALPEVKHVVHTNFCDIGWRVDPAGRAVLVSVIDNLVKGAAGQAVQNMNVMLGVNECTGLI